MKHFDLNIESILESWDVYHGVRELIANAIDEFKLTNSKEMQIFKDKSNIWHVRDFGRGLSYQHLTQNENPEKLAAEGIIGRFGIGLKDALATFDRHGVKVTIISKHGIMTLEKAQKHGFEDLVTLHVSITENPDKAFIGTDVMLEHAEDKDIDLAKSLFLQFSKDRKLESTKYGDILEKRTEVARVYINGVRVAEEQNFLFSYNITALTAPIKKALNRERTNVGRNAYSDRVKSMLLASQSNAVAKVLVDDLQSFQHGAMHDEMQWIDVQTHAVKILNAGGKKVVFVTPEEMVSNTMMMDEVKQSGYEIVSIPSNLREKIRGATDLNGGTITDLTEFSRLYEESFEYDFVDPKTLSDAEKAIFGKTEQIFRLIGGKPQDVQQVKISNTMKKDLTDFEEKAGVWDNGTIIVKRDQLNDLSEYASTLLHEAGHAESGAQDVNKMFELTLTKYIGILVSRALDTKK